MKVIVGGPPHSGKSCLLYGLKGAISHIPGAPYPNIIPVCPDGEGAWFHETMSTDPERGSQLKAAKKSKFTQEQATLYESWVSNWEEGLALFDLGGRVDDKNKNICKHATHAILIAGDLKNLNDWRVLCAELNLPIIAELHSDLHATEDSSLVKDANGCFFGTVHKLERSDESMRRRPTIVQLAELLVEMSVDFQKIETEI